MDRQFSVIIPTMWKSDKLARMMKIYDDCPFISEVILIDNDVTRRNILASSKLRILKQPRNIFVNPAWNLGMKTALNEWVIIANDDVYIERLTELLYLVSKTDYDLIGVDINGCRINSVIDLKETDTLYWGFGCFMIVKKSSFKPIHSALKIWYGDNVIFSNAKKRAMFSGLFLDTFMGETMRHGFSSVAARDKPYWRQLQKRFNYVSLVTPPKEMKIQPYTVNVDNYDKPRTDLLCFTDYNRFKHPERNSRIYFILPHKFIECDISILVSPEVKVKVPYEKLVEEWLGDYDMALFKHPWRDCVHQEIKAAEVRVKKQDELDILRKQGEHYKRIGIPENMGNLPETGIIIRRHNEIVKRFCEAWWAEMCRWSYRDQCSFSVVLKEFPQLKVRFIEPDVRVHPYTEIMHRHLK